MPTCRVPTLLLAAIVGALAFQSRVKADERSSKRTQRVEALRPDLVPEPLTVRKRDNIS